MLPIEILLKTILTGYFSNSRCLVVIQDDNDATINFNVDMPMLVLRRSNDTGILFNYIGCQDFLIISSNAVKIFQLIEHAIQINQDRFNKRKYVFYTGKSDMVSIFSSQEIEYVSDVLVILKEDDERTNSWLKEGDGTNIFSLWTHYYKGEINNSEIYLLDKWYSGNISFLFGTNLFPEKLVDQEGRSLRIAVFSYEPYVIIERTGNDSYLYMGTEMLALTTFAEYLNMTIIPVINQFDYWGEIWDNWSGNGLMGNLVEDKADIGGSALYTWESSYKYLDLSKPTVRTGITCLVPAPNLAAGWLTPIQVFSPYSWMAVISTFLMSLFLLYFLDVLQISIKKRTNLKLHEKMKIFENTLITVTKPFVMQNVTNYELISGMLAKYMMGLVFITTLILSVSYDSGLATIMTIPRYENPINTVDEFAESGLSWGATQEAWILSIKDSNESNLKKVVSKFVATSEEGLRQLSLSGTFAFSVERLPHDNYAIGSYIQEDVIQNFHLMTEDFYWEYCVYMLRKNSILLPILDMFVLRVYEAGLLSYWQNEAATLYMNQYVQKAVKYYYHHQKDRDIVKLKMTHVQGAFAILIVGNTLALVVFFAELLYYRLFEKVVFNNVQL